MDRLGMGRLGLWVFAAGMFAWIFPNALVGNGTNVATDVALTAFGVVAAAGLARAVDGIGTGPLRVGLWGIAASQLLQNAVSAATGLGAVNAAPIAVVVLGSLALAWGTRRWQQDAWDTDATPWLCAGFAAFAFEPLYYFALGLASGSVLGPYFPGSVLVAAGAVLCAAAFRPGEADLDRP